MLPSIFGENLFDDWMGFPFRDFGTERKLYGKHAAHVMKTDLREHEGGYELAIDLPGFKKDEISLALENGYLTVSAAKSVSEEGTDRHDRLVHQERYAGQMSRSFYVGDGVGEEDVKARFEDGVLTLTFPKAEEKQLPQRKTIQIEG